MGRRRSNVALRFTKADDMAADALAKMSPALLLDKIRDTMAGNLPATPGHSQDLEAEKEESWWASRVLKPVDHHGAAGATGTLGEIASLMGGWRADQSSTFRAQPAPR